jgi:hypothetical protein
LEFVVDLAKKAAVFIGIFVVGLTLSQVGAFLDTRHEHWSLVYGANFTAHLVTACDILGFGVYVILSTIRLILRMFLDAGIDVIGLMGRTRTRWKRRDPINRATELRSEDATA